MSTVAVFGASGRQGQAQVRALLAAGHQARAISRTPEVFTGPGFTGAEVIPADYADPASLDAALDGVDVMFFQPPQAQAPERVMGFAQNLAAAAERARVRRVVHNTTMWAPDEPCGQPLYDFALALEKALAGRAFPLVIFRPAVYMDNWLTAFAKPALVNEHTYRYPHKPDLRFSPVSLDDVAAFMIAVIDRDDLDGERIRVGGPQTLGPADVQAVLTDAMGTPISYEYVAPTEFGRYVYSLMGASTGVGEDTYAAVFGDFYTFNNDAPQQPFRFDVAPVLERIPVQLETFAVWARRQDWTTLDEAVGSATR